MLSLIDIITYNYKNHKDVGSIGKLKIEKLAAKLKLLEVKIVNEKSGIIAISRKGNLHVNNFTKDLSSEITSTIYGFNHLLIK